MKSNLVSNLNFRFWILDFGVTGLSPIQNPKSKTQNSLFSARAQAVVEYAILIAVVIAAMLTIQTYARRGIQAGIKIAADQIGSQREGIIESNMNMDWKVKGKSKVIATSTATRTFESRPEGEQVYGTKETTTSRGTLSFSVGAERGQQ